MSATQVKMERETMFKYKKQVQELEDKILETEQKLIKRGLEKSSLKIENDGLKIRLEEAMTRIQMQSDFHGAMIKKLALAEAEIISRGENFNRLKAMIDTAIEDLQYYCDWEKDSYIGPQGILDNLKEGLTPKTIRKDAV